MLGQPVGEPSERVTAERACGPRAARRELSHVLRAEVQLPRTVSYPRDQSDPPYQIRPGC